MSRPAHWMRQGWPRRVRDWEGVRVETRRQFSSHFASMPQGSKATVRRTTRSTSVSIEFDECDHCGVKIYMTRVSWNDLRVVSTSDRGEEGRGRPC